MGAILVLHTVLGVRGEAAMRPTHYWKMIPVALLAWIGLAGPVGAQVAPLYVLTALGTLPGGTNSRAFGINATTEVDGYSTTAVSPPPPPPPLPAAAPHPPRPAP